MFYAHSSWNWMFLVTTFPVLFSTSCSSLMSLVKLISPVSYLLKTFRKLVTWRHLCYWFHRFLAGIFLENDQVRDFGFEFQQNFRRDPFWIISRYIQPLQNLILDFNYLTGLILPTLSNWISLSNNKLPGEIPTSLGGLSNLAILKLRNDSFLSNIPPELGDCKSFIWLDLNTNELNCWCLSHRKTICVHK